MTKATPKRFKIAGEVLEFASSADVTLRDVLLVEKETTELGRKIHMGEIARLGDRFQTLTEDEQKYDEDSGWMLAITVWMAKVKKLRDSGDANTQVSFGDAINFSLDDFEVMPEPADHLSSGKAARKTPTPKGSSPADASPAAAQ